MNYKQIYRAFGWITFVVTFITYFLTAQPSTPFWDCGEFSAATTWQQVPHPPGTPLFLMVGKIFQLIPIGDLNFRVNLISVTATAFACFLLYFIIVMVLENFRKEEYKNLAEVISVYGSAMVGALAFCYTDTLWFNGVESEVYASTTVLTMIMVYLMMRWNKVADEPKSERYLLLMVYIVVLSSGVHLLAILTVYSIVILVFFRKYPLTIKGFAIMSVIALVTFFFIYQVVIMWTPTFFAGHLPLKNAAREYLISDSPFMTILPILAVGVAAYGLWYGMKKHKEILKLVCSSILLMALAYSVNTHIIIRANSNPVLNENEPKTFNRVVSYLGREQYGESRYWPRRYEFYDRSKIQYYEQYGKWYPPSQVPVVNNAGQTVYDYEFDKVNTAGELKYMWDYQINHEFIRYLLWNFVGRESDIQDASFTFIDKKDADNLNFNNGYKKDFPVRFFAFPLIFALIGFFYHFKKDPKMAFVYFIMFLLMGVLATLAQNQLKQQPRERDYFYTGAFLCICVWISVGVYSVIEYAGKKKLTTAIAGGLVALSLLLVPVNMAVGGWKVHSRAGNYLPFDFAYNLLQSCEKNAIIFTVGDNDTFPIWNIQDVLGIRRDVRVVNLSLGGTRWYIHQLKNNEPWDAPKINLSFTNESLTCPDDDPKALSPYDLLAPIKVNIPVNKSFMSQFTTDSNALANPIMSFTFLGENQQKDGKYAYDIPHKLVLDILKNNMNDRPIYFSITAGGDVYKYGLNNFLRYEGMAFRVIPIDNSKTKTGMINGEVMEKCLLDSVDNTNNYFTGPHYGFKFRNLNNPSVYYDDVHRRYLDSYRQLYMNYSTFCLQTLKDSAKCIKVLDAMNNNISIVQFPLLYDEQVHIAKIYDQAGDTTKARDFARQCINTCTQIWNNPKLRQGRIQSTSDEITGKFGDGTYKCAAQAYYVLGNYDEGFKALMNLYDLIKPYFNQLDKSQASKSQIESIQRNVYDMMSLASQIDEKQLKDIKDKYGEQAEKDSLAEKVKRYNASNDPLLKMLANTLNERINGKPQENGNQQAPQDQLDNNYDQEQQ